MKFLPNIHSISYNQFQFNILYNKITSFISGNKVWKLKYNIQKAKDENIKTLISIGGAYSNNILAIAEASNKHGFNSVGIIRGEELATKPYNQYLECASSLNMKLHFIPREKYRYPLQRNKFVSSVSSKYPHAYYIEEGGCNFEGYLGVKDFASDIPEEYSTIALPCGTGTTLAGFLSALPKVKFFAFLSLKNKPQIISNIQSLLLQDNRETNFDRVEFIENYTFGGFAKNNEILQEFVKDFTQQTSIPLEPRYSGKMMFGLSDLHLKEKIPKNILVIHTGGAFLEK